MARSDALDIFQSAVRAALPKTAIEKSMKYVAETDALHVQNKVFDMKDYDSIRIIGFGKAAAEMVSTVRNIVLPLKTKDIYGHLVTKHDHVKDSDNLGSENDLPLITVTEASHPVPCNNGVKGTKTIVEILKNCTSDRTLVFACVSGGGSALLVKPVDGISLEDLQETNNVLLKNGLTINEMNTIRKHLSDVKGGQLARLAHPSTICSLILSDVIGDPLDIIASGPTVPDPSTFKNCIDIVNAYNLKDKLPESVYNHLNRGYQNPASSNSDTSTALETPTHGDPCFNTSHNFVIGNNSIAVEAAENEAKHKGYNTMVLSTSVEGEAKEVGIVFSSLMKEVMKSDRPIRKPACIIAGGETTVTVNANVATGNGGRQQELALSAATHIMELGDVSSEAGSVAVLLAGGTDGTDGPNDAAGAIVDRNTVASGLKKNLDAKAYLDNHDSYNYFKGLADNSLIKTGPTGTNVADVTVMIVR